MEVPKPIKTNIPFSQAITEMKVLLDNAKEGQYIAVICNDENGLHFVETFHSALSVYLTSAIQMFYEEKYAVH